MINDLSIDGVLDKALTDSDIQKVLYQGNWFNVAKKWVNWVGGGIVGVLGLVAIVYGVIWLYQGATADFDFKKMGKAVGLMILGAVMAFWGYSWFNSNARSGISNLPK